MIEKASSDNLYHKTKLNFMDKYQPNPLNTADIELSESLVELTEKMARNVHEVWAAGRLADGWVWGEGRNDALKTHPCLIPYDELSESEREYDRHTAIETLKLILSLGFSIKMEEPFISDEVYIDGKAVQLFMRGTSTLVGMDWNDYTMFRSHADRLLALELSAPADELPVLLAERMKALPEAPKSVMVNFITSDVEALTFECTNNILTAVQTDAENPANLLWGTWSDEKVAEGAISLFLIFGF